MHSINSYNTTLKKQFYMYMLMTFYGHGQV